jgi:aldose 1-epimerase
MARKRQSVGQTIGGIIAGIEHQIFRTTPPANELVAKGAPIRPVATSSGGTIEVGFPDDAEPGGGNARYLRFEAPGATAIVDLHEGGRLASFVVQGHELLKTEGDGPIQWGSFPMVPYAGRIRHGRFEFRGRAHNLPMQLPPHAIHGTVLNRPWTRLDERSIETDLGAEWPFRGRAVQSFDLSEGRFASRLELHADEPMPASMGWHPWFRRQLSPHAAPVELEFDADFMFNRDAEGITTTERIAPTPGPWDDCFADLSHPPILRWPGMLELTIESDCPTWVVYTVPTDALCVEPQTAPPDTLNQDPPVVEPGRPLVAEMTWTWRTLAG